MRAVQAKLASMSDARDLLGRRILVTGSAAGIGREVARQLAARGAVVIVTARDLARAEALVAELGNGAEAVALDVADLASIATAARTLAERSDRLDALVNNAGVLVRERHVNRSGRELTWATNVLGPFALTRALEPLLRATLAPRVVMVGSVAHRYARMEWDDLEFERRSMRLGMAYSQSKLALQLVTRAFATHVPELATNCVHPGAIGTGIFRNTPALVRALLGRFLPAPAAGAEPVVRLLVDPALAHARGLYFNRMNDETPSEAARSDADAERLWSLLETQAARA